MPALAQNMYTYIPGPRLGGSKLSENTVHACVGRKLNSKPVLDYQAIQTRRKIPKAMLLEPMHFNNHVHLGYEHLGISGSPQQ